MTHEPSDIGAFLSYTGLDAYGELSDIMQFLLRHPLFRTVLRPVVFEPFAAGPIGELVAQSLRDCGAYLIMIGDARERSHRQREISQELDLVRKQGISALAVRANTNSGDTKDQLLQQLAHQGIDVAEFASPSELKKLVTDWLLAVLKEKHGICPEGVASGSVFLSHSSLDSMFVQRLAKDFTAYGIPVWYSGWEMNVGDSVRERIEQAIEESAWLVVVLSKQSVTSKWVKEELNGAFAKSIEQDFDFILPVLLEDCKVPRFLQARLYADFRTDYQAGLTALLRRFGFTSPESSIHPFVANSKTTSSRNAQ